MVGTNSNRENRLGPDLFGQSRRRVKQANSICTVEREDAVDETAFMTLIFLPGIISSKICGSCFLDCTNQAMRFGIVGPAERQNGTRQ